MSAQGPKVKFQRISQERVVRSGAADHLFNEISDERKGSCRKAKLRVNESVWTGFSVLAQPSQAQSLAFGQQPSSS